MTRVDLQAGDRAGGRVLAGLGLLGLGQLEVDERARRLAVGAEHHEADAQRAADHLRALDRAPLEGHERRRRAAAAPAARLHHLQQLDRVVLDRLVGALQGGVEQELHADRPRHAAAELGLRRVGAGDGLDRPDVGLGDRVLLRVERALDRVAAVDDQLRALEVLRERHRLRPSSARSGRCRGISVAMPDGAAAMVGPLQRTGQASAKVHARLVLPSWRLELDR